MMKYKIIPSIFLFVLMTVLGISSAHSHGSGGEFVQEKNGYKIDVGYEPKELYANEPSNFDFRLLKGGKNVEYSDIWVRIVQENQTILATGVHNQDFGGTTLLYEFPTGGTYTIHARYQKDGESLVESEFPVTVFESEGGGTFDTGKKMMFVFGLIISLFLGSALGIIIGRTTKLLR